MVFGSCKSIDQNQIDIEEADEHIDLDAGDEHEGDADGTDEEDESAEHGTDISAKSFWDEVISLDAPTGKNPGGTKPWQCKHCQKKFKSSYTRICQHFFGPLPGERKQISRCSVANDHAKYKKIYHKVHAHIFV